jgi:hypothetical protein
MALFLQLLSRAELNNLSPEELQELAIAVAQKLPALHDARQEPGSSSE